MDSDYFLSGLFDLEILQWHTVWPIIGVCVAILFVCVSGFISAVEVAFFSLSPADMNEIKEKRHPSDSVIAHLLERSEYLLATILVIHSFVNVTIVIVCAYIIGNVVDYSFPPWFVFILQILIPAFLLLLFCEIMPKVNALENPLNFSRKAAGIINGMEIVCRPLSKLLVGSTSVINKALARKRHETPADELSKALELTSKETPEEKEMIEDIIKFYNKTAGEIMTSRLDVEDIEMQTPFCDVMQLIIDSGYSRIPVFAETEDNIKGILYVKDLLPYIDKQDTFRWQNLIRPAYFVPETKKIDELLEEFRTNKIHMAIVIDEFGGTSGIVTMEDILEEIVGDISDEYDEEERQFIRLADGSLIFEAKIPLMDFFRVIDCDPSEFEELTDEVETLAGLLLELKGDFPKRQEIIEYKGYRFQVLEIDNRRIQKVKFTRISDLGKEES
ncbi:MAG: gliding motility-associated protein GldE [Tannerellaceae bacterium]|nr:gliding motility-associated protein GldE [Tannerellaceae bacterium]